MASLFGVGVNASSRTVGAYLGTVHSSVLVHCLVDFPLAPEVNAGVLDDIRDQLARWGPQNFTLPAAAQLAGW